MEFSDLQYQYQIQYSLVFQVYRHNLLASEVKDFTVESIENER